MTREESIKLLKNLVEEYKEEKEFVGKELIEAIECLLNELEKNTETINNLINEVTIKDECFEPNKLCGDCIKEYFYKLVEGNIDKK